MEPLPEALSSPDNRRTAAAMLTQGFAQILVYPAGKRAVHSVAEAAGFRSNSTGAEASRQNLQCGAKAWR